MTVCAMLKALGYVGRELGKPLIQLLTVFLHFVLYKCHNSPGTSLSRPHSQTRNLKLVTNALQVAGILCPLSISHVFVNSASFGFILILK